MKKLKKTKTEVRAYNTSSTGLYSFEVWRNGDLKFHAELNDPGLYDEIRTMHEEGTSPEMEFQSFADAAKHIKSRMK